MGNLFFIITNLLAFGLLLGIFTTSSKEFIFYLLEEYKAYKKKKLLKGKKNAIGDEREEKSSEITEITPIRGGDLNITNLNISNYTAREGINITKVMEALGFKKQVSTFVGTVSLAKPEISELARILY
jgi:hypothetical protein